MRVTFDQDSVRRYSFTHGHAPRGRGGWAFELAFYNGKGGERKATYFTHDLRTFTEAKAGAMAHAKANAIPGTSHSVVAVLS